VWKNEDTPTHHTSETKKGEGKAVITAREKRFHLRSESRTKASKVQRSGIEQARGKGLMEW
jgi:hypothetical protein